MRARGNFRCDLYFGSEEIVRGAQFAQPLRVGELLRENKWIVEQLVPAVDPSIDCEVYLRRVGPNEVLRPMMSYTVIMRGEAMNQVAAYTTRDPLAPGDVIALGVERWRILRIRLGGDLMDGIIEVERT